MQLDSQWVIAIANSISAIGLLLVVVQIRYSAKALNIASSSLTNAVSQLELSKKAFVENLDYERRRKAIVLLKDWTMYISSVGTGAKAFAEQLDEEKSKLLWKEKSFDIEKKHKFYLEKTVPELGEISILSDEVARLTDYQVSQLRKQAISYLNLLETILSARRHNVADEDMLKEQFCNLVSFKDGKTILPYLRKVAGGYDAFPSIELFVKELESDREANINSKNKLGNL